MKPFSLDNVLAYRKRLEDLAQHRFLEARRVQRQLEERLAAEEELLAGLCQESEEKQQQGMAIDELIRYEERIAQVRSNVAAIAKNLAEKIKIVAAEQKQLVRRVRERQIMEKLKERQNREWALYLEKKETAMLDEIAILRHEDHER